MFSRRLFTDNGDWMSQPAGITVPLSPLTDPGAHANLGIKLAFNRNGNAWDYFVEYIIPTHWTTGLPKPTVFIRRRANVPGTGDTAIILGTIDVPIAPGVTAQWTEPTGNVQFTATWLDTQGRILKVTAVKL
jgi:hypothetical protein